MERDNIEMEELEDTLNVHDESKRKEFKPLSIKPTLSEMFLEATNHLKSTEMNPEEIRNYTLSRYDVDVINCMNDINLLTRFSEIKVPKKSVAVAGTRTNANKQLRNLKTVRRVTGSKSKKTKLPKKKKSRSIGKKVTSKKHPSTKHAGKTKIKRTSAKGNTATKEKQMNSRISLIHLIRNKSSLKKEYDVKKDFDKRNASASKNVFAPSDLQSHRDSMTKRENEKSFGSISKSSDSDVAKKCGRSQTSANSLVDPRALTGDKGKMHGTSHKAFSDFEKSPGKDTTHKQRTCKDGEKNLKSESKIMKAGYAVRNFIEDLGTKCASSLMFINHRNLDKQQIKRDDGIQGLLHNNLRKVKIDLIQDDKLKMKINADSKPSDLQGNTETTDSAHHGLQWSKAIANFKNDCLQGGKVGAEIGANADLQSNKRVEFVGKDSKESIAKTGLKRSDLSNDKGRADPVKSSTVIRSDVSAVKELESVVSLPGDGNTSSNKQSDDEERDVLQMKEFGESEKLRKKQIVVSSETESVKTVKNHPKIPATRFSTNRNKLEPKSKLRSFENGRKSGNEISRQGKRTCGGTSSRLSVPSIRKKGKRTHAKVTFADDCEEKCSRGKIRDEIYVPKNGASNIDNRMERLKELVEKRRLKKKLE